MTCASTVVTSRRRQHELLACWSGWSLTSILMDPAEVAQIRESGWAGTHHHDPETGSRIAGTRAGLGFWVDDSWNNPVEVIPWNEIEAIAKRVPAELREEFIAFLEVWSAHQSAYPRFTASAATTSCGPCAATGPLTERQVLYVCELEAFDASGVLSAWQERRDILDADRLSLHARALWYDAGSEAFDLLDLLEVQQSEHTPTAAAGVRQRAPGHTGGLSEEAGQTEGMAQRPGLQPPTTTRPQRDLNTPAGRLDAEIGAAR